MRRYLPFTIVIGVGLGRLCVAAFVMIGCGACHKQAVQPSNEKKAALPNVEACSLLTADDIQQIQPDTTLTDTKSSETVNGQIRVSQCYFGTQPSNRSVALTVILPNPAGGGEDGARNSWQQSFSRAKQPASEADKEKRESLREHERGEEEEGRPPKKIDGIGEEAFWAGSRVGGALYVLKGDLYIRISLGGPDTESDKIDRTKKLAEKALRRLK